MKNIHLVLAGESRLSLNRSYRDYAIGTEVSKPYWIYSQYKHHMSVTDASVRPHNMYITNEEKFVRDEYITDGIEVIKATPKLVNAQGLVDRRDWKKIILTTDQELTKDGVWGIEDGFLEWFVKNPTCEYVELKGYAIILPGESCDCDNICNTCKEKEPKLQCKDCNDNLTDCTCIEDIVDMKQETLEEAAQRVFDGFADITKPSAVRRALELVKWQQEQDKNKYSEEDMKSSFQVGFNVGYNDEESPSYLTFEEWIKEYKKK